ncbi:MAG: hypothetical protein V4561_00745 [Bacteroidota bacterium]
MTQTKFFLPALLAILGSFIFYSCGKCGGCDDIVTTTGAYLVVNENMRDLKESAATGRILINPTTTETDGDRKCFQKDLVICLNDGLSASKMSLKCDKELLLKEGEVTALKNLFEVTFVQASSSSGSEGLPEIILRADSKMAPGMYTFTLEGTTNEGKAIKDTATIIWF